MSYVKVTVELKADENDSREDSITVVATRWGSIEDDDIITLATNDAAARATAAAQTQPEGDGRTD